MSNYCFSGSYSNVLGGGPIISIPDSITEIGMSALYYANCGKKLFLPNVTRIDENGIRPISAQYDDTITLTLNLSKIIDLGYQALSLQIGSIIEDLVTGTTINSDDEGFVMFHYGPANAYEYSGYFIGGLNGPECVAAGTQILIDSIGNTKNVEDLKEGDIVLTKDGDSYIEAPIDKVVIKTHFNYYILTLEDGTSVTISDDHAIMTADGWKSLYPIITEHPKDVNRLTEKDSVQIRNGLVKIKSIEHQHLTEEPLTMYNIGVSGYYNYFANNILVYECSGSE